MAKRTGPAKCQGGSVCIACRRTIHGHLTKVMQKGRHALLHASCLYCGRVGEEQQRQVDWVASRCQTEMVSW